MAFDWQYELGIHMPWGAGQTPNAKFFESGIAISQAEAVHENPRFYKYVWQIWTAKNAFPDFDALSAMNYAERHAFEMQYAGDPSWISFSVAMQEIKTLHEKGETFLVRNKALKRISPDTPWDKSRLKADARAPSYDDDVDVEFCRHK